MGGGDQISKAGLQETNRSVFPMVGNSKYVNISKTIGWCLYTKSPWLAGRCYTIGLVVQALSLQLCQNPSRAK